MPSGDDMTRGTVPPPDQLIKSLQASNAVLRRELQDDEPKARRAFWRGALIFCVIGFALGLAF